MAVPFRRAGTFHLGCALVLRMSRNNFYQESLVSICRKGAAQAKNELNGKAQPFLTTGGKAISKRKAF